MFKSKLINTAVFVIIGFFLLRPVFGQQKEETATLRVGVIPLVEHIPILLAQKDASLASSGKVSLDIYTSWTGLEAAFRTGAIDAAAISLPKALMMAYEGIPLKIILIVNRNGSAIVLKGGDSVSELKGKITGGSGSDTMDLIVFARFLKDKKLKLGYEVRSLLIPFSKAVSLIKEDRIYGFCLPEPYGVLAEKEGVAKKVILSKDIYPNHIDSVLIVNPKILASNPELVKQLAKSILRQQGVIEKDKKDSSGKQTAMAQVNVFRLDPVLVAKALTTPADRVLFANSTPTVREIDEVMRALMEVGALGGMVNLKDVVEARFAD